jgi:ubiquinone/menaquinone biosynthesis C-methylase UbiE
MSQEIPPIEVDLQGQAGLVRDRLIRVTETQFCCDPEWEAAYQRFETPAQEIRKFTRRLHRLGQRDWPRSARIVELFCGRGNGMVAFERLGFTHLDGVDLSESLLREYRGAATCYVADCRQLPFPDASRDIVTVHGGLHHLPQLSEDLPLVLAETHRILTDGGMLAVVEPWLTPFLSFYHWVLFQPWARWGWGKIDASAIMVEREAETYFRWLNHPAFVLDSVANYFAPIRCRIAWGKLLYLGRKLPAPQNPSLSGSR